jgi:ubiquitin-like protein 4
VTLPIQPADSIQHLKSLLTTSASPLTGTTVRLLLKGKALADTKLVKDYEIKDGSVITVMMSAPAAASTTNKSSPDTPIADAASAAAAAAPSTTSAATPSYSMDLSAADRDPVPAAASPSLGASTPGMGHKRRVSDIPAVTLSPAGTPAATTPLLQPVSLTADPLAHIPLTPSSPSSKSTSIAIDLASIPLPLSTSSQHSDDPYHQTLASPQFWKDLKGFLDGRFGKEKGGRVGDEQIAFEEFLRSVKGSLSPNEIARIRDEVGITGMAGN